VEVLGKGSDVAIVVMGGITSEASAAQAVLAAEGIAATLVVVSTLSPPPEHDLANVISRFCSL
jgi:transketolase C-terminal domain/subunit